MSRYMLLLRGGTEEVREYSPQQMQDLLQKYLSWTEQLRVSGKLLSADQLQDSGRVLQANGQGIVEGPYIETKERVGGYFAIEARDLDEATEIARGCPMLSQGGFVEVRGIVERAPTA